MNNRDDIYAFLSPDERIQRGGLTTNVADQLRRAIINSQISPGTMLDKAEICARLGVSRSPVVDAFARLRNEGFVEILPQRGTVVTYLSIADVRELVFIRQGLECAAVKALAQVATPDVVAAMRDTLSRQKAALDTGDADAFYGLDGAFHDQLVAPLSHRRLREMLKTVRNNLSRARRMTNTPERIAGGYVEHIEIVDALERGDGEGAAALIDTHLDKITIEVERLARERPDLFSDDGIIQQA